MQLQEITAFLESRAPLCYQESYDNAGIQVGEPGSEIHGMLIALDVTEAVIDEAIEHKLNLVVAHHPVIFGGIHSLTGRTMPERVVMKALRNGIAIYAAHTNLDAMDDGVNRRICDKLGLQQPRILDPAAGRLKKLAVFVPRDHADKLREALFGAGAGNIGAYDSCSFNLEGTGTFRGDETTNPYVGEQGKLHHEEEVRVETVFPDHLKGTVLHAMFHAHPYEEVAYDIYPLENRYDRVGMGMIGTLEEPLEEQAFLDRLKIRFEAACIRHTALRGTKIRRVAVAGGAGSFLLGKAIGAGADAFVSSDFKYHQFFGAEDRIMIADIGHFESEQFTRELFYERLTKKFPKFAVRLSNVHTNPIKYF